jgi:hypothetical protein
LLCKDEYDLYEEEWTQVIEARPRYKNIMSGLITDKEEQASNDDKNQFDDYSDNNRRQAFFLLHHQMLPIISGSPITQRRQPSFVILS